MVLVDTSVWSLALRRRPRDLNAAEKSIVDEWSSLVRSGAAALIGPIRQEILSGVRRTGEFDRLRTVLSAFRYIPILPRDYDEAASYLNRCRARGIAGTSVDLLLCAVATRAKAAVFAVDVDFEQFEKALPLRLHRT